MPLLCCRTTDPRKCESVAEINKDHHHVQISVHYVLRKSILDMNTFIQQIQIDFILFCIP
jgi:hypothetical protein